MKITFVAHRDPDSATQDVFLICKKLNYIFLNLDGLLKVSKVTKA